MEQLTPEQIMSNLERFYGLIETHIQEPRKTQLLEFYKKHEDELVMMPASAKTSFHNSKPGGYVDHVVRVVEASLEINEVWKKFNVDSSTYTTEELVFSAINHDLGKMGDGELYSHIPSTDQWRKEKLGENYSFNDKIAFMKVPDRSLYLLSQAGINISENEWIAIKTHDGLYDEGNTAYLKAYNNGSRPRSSITFILHQGDMLAARVEWENDNLAQFQIQDKKKDTTEHKKPLTKKSKALKSVGNPVLDNLLKGI